MYFQTCWQKESVKYQCRFLNLTEDGWIIGIVTGGGNQSTRRKPPINGLIVTDNYPTYTRFWWYFNPGRGGRLWFWSWGLKPFLLRYAAEQNKTTSNPSDVVIIYKTWFPNCSDSKWFKTFHRQAHFLIFSPILSWNKIFKHFFFAKII